jgi:hypothetical protein
MRTAGFTLPALAPALALALAACGSAEREPPEASAQRGIDRSVADIRAAEAAVKEPATVSRSVGELTGKAAAASKDAAEKTDAADGDAAPAEG